MVNEARNGSSPDPLDHVQVGPHRFPLFSHPLYRVRAYENAYVEEAVEEQLQNPQIIAALEELVERLLHQGRTGATAQDIEALLQQELGLLEADFSREAEIATPSTARPGDVQQNCLPRGSYTSINGTPWQTLVPAQQQCTHLSSPIPASTGEGRQGQKNPHASQRRPPGPFSSPLVTGFSSLQAQGIGSSQVKHTPTRQMTLTSTPATAIKGKVGPRTPGRLPPMPTLKDTATKHSRLVKGFEPTVLTTQGMHLDQTEQQEHNEETKNEKYVESFFNFAPSTFSAWGRAERAASIAAQKHGTSSLSSHSSSQRPTNGSQNSFSADSTNKTQLWLRQYQHHQHDEYLKSLRWKEAMRTAVYSLLHLRVVESAVGSSSKGTAVARTGITLSDIGRAKAAQTAVDTEKFNEMDNGTFEAMDVFMDGNSSCLRRRVRPTVNKMTPMQLATLRQQQQQTKVGLSVRGGMAPPKSAMEAKARSVIAVHRRQLVLEQQEWEKGGGIGIRLDAEARKPQESLLNGHQWCEETNTRNVSGGGRGLSFSLHHKMTSSAPSLMLSSFSRAVDHGAPVQIADNAEARWSRDGALDKAMESVHNSFL